MKKFISMHFFIDFNCLGFRIHYSYRPTFLESPHYLSVKKESIEFHFGAQTYPLLIAKLTSDENKLGYNLKVVIQNKLNAEVEIK